MMHTDTPRFSFHDGELEIAAETRSYRLCGWPCPAARQKDKEGVWMEFRPEFRLLKPETDGSASAAGPGAPASPDRPAPTDDPDAKQRAFTAFRAQLPHTVAHAAERFQSHQWNLIDLLSREDAAQDLAASNPNLAWCLANCDQFRRLVVTASPAECAQPHVRKKQVEILQWLGFPPSDSMVRLLGKILPEAMTPLDARMLRRAAAEPGVADLLAHVRPINAGVLGLACNFKLLPSISARLLAEVSRTEGETTRQPTADRLIDALYIMALGQIRLEIPRFAAINAVYDFHDRVVAEWQRRREQSRRRVREMRERNKRRGPLAFPPPPVPGTQDVVPLTTSEELKNEGLAQRNCVGSYGRKVRSGGIYIYRVLSPERATLAIVLGPDGCWRRAEIRCAGNRPASRATRAALDQWLNRYSLSVT